MTKTVRVLARVESLVEVGPLGACLQLVCGHQAYWVPPDVPLSEQQQQNWRQIFALGNLPRRAPCDRCPVPPRRMKSGANTR